MKAYISGPMTGIENYNFKEFESAKTWLLKNTQYEVVSPHDAPKMDSYEEYMRHDIKLLCECDTIVMLPGWENSKGANLERAVSNAIDNELFYLRKKPNGEWFLIPEA